MRTQNYIGIGSTRILERWICGLHEVMRAIDIASMPYMNNQQLSVLNEWKVENMLTLEHFR